MEKYRRVLKPKEPTPEGEIRISSMGRVASYISYAARLLTEEEKDHFTIKATGNALMKAVNVAEILKRRIVGLHQITKISSHDIVDEFEPLEEGLDRVFHTKSVAVIAITLSKSPLDNKDLGYQAPLPEDQVVEFDPEKVIKGRPRGSKGKGKGSKGKGKGKGKGGSKGGKGKGKGHSHGSPGHYGRRSRQSSPSASPTSRGSAPQEGRGRGSKGKGKGKGKKQQREEPQPEYSEPRRNSKGKGGSKGGSRGSKGGYKGGSKGGKGKGYDDYYGKGGYGYGGYGYGDYYGYDSYGGKGKSYGKGGKSYNKGWW